MPARKKEHKTYSTGNKSKLNIMHNIFGKPIEKKKLRRKHKIEIKELSPRADKNICLQDHSNPEFNNDNTFDRLMNATDYHKVSYKPVHEQNYSTSISVSSIKIDTHIYSPVKLNKKRKRRNKVAFESFRSPIITRNLSRNCDSISVTPTDEKMKKTLERSVNESLWIEKEIKSNFQEPVCDFMENDMEKLNRFAQVYGDRTDNNILSIPCENIKSNYLNTSFLTYIDPMSTPVKSITLRKFTDETLSPIFNMSSSNRPETKTTPKLERRYSKPRQLKLMSGVNDILSQNNSEYLKTKNCNYSSELFKDTLDRDLCDTVAIYEKHRNKNVSKLWLTPVVNITNHSNLMSVVKNAKVHLGKTVNINEDEFHLSTRKPLADVSNRNIKLNSKSKCVKNDFAQVSANKVAFVDITICDIQSYLDNNSINSVDANVKTCKTTPPYLLEDIHLHLQPVVNLTNINVERFLETKHAVNGINDYSESTTLSDTWDSTKSSRNFSTSNDVNSDNSIVELRKHKNTKYLKNTNLDNDDSSSIIKYKQKRTSIRKNLEQSFADISEAECSINSKWILSGGFLNNAKNKVGPYITLRNRRLFPKIIFRKRRNRSQNMASDSSKSTSNNSNDDNSAENLSVTPENPNIAVSSYATDESINKNVDKPPVLKEELDRLSMNFYDEAKALELCKFPNQKNYLENDTEKDSFKLGTVTKYKQIGQSNQIMNHEAFQKTEEQFNQLSPHIDPQNGSPKVLHSTNQNRSGSNTEKSIFQSKGDSVEEQIDRTASDKPEASSLAVRGTTETQSSENKSQEKTDDVEFVRPTLPRIKLREKPKKIGEELVLKPGKWRRSLLEVRHSKIGVVEATKLPGDTIDTCSDRKNKIIENTPPRRLSVRVVPLSCQQDPAGNRNTTVLESYAVSCRKSFITNVLQDKSILEECFENLSLTRDNAIVNLEDDTYSHQKVTVTARDVVFRKCGQTEALPFEKCYPNSILQHCQKIGEGVYGEVFLFRRPNGGTSVMKVIPIEGDLIVNGERQKKFEEILSEITIAMELSGLRNDSKNNTNGFTELHRVTCVKGKYPPRLIELWELFDEARRSENDHPDLFDEDQLYVVLELANGGIDMESFVFNNAQQAHALITQVACALAVAESSLEFEHRDLHWGNVLISHVGKRDTISFCLDGQKVLLNTHGICVVVIDFTLSRISYDGVCIYNDLALDPDLFTATGDYQFDVYRLMNKQNRNDWQHFEPYTNILWLHYLLDKVIGGVRYKNKNSKVHKTYIMELIKLKDDVLQYKSAEELVNAHFIHNNV